MSLMLRARAALGRIFRKQGLLVNSFYVLRQGLTNYKLFAEGWTTETETGHEDKNKGSFELPESFAGPPGAAPVKGGKAPPPAKGAKDAKGAKGGAATEDQSANLEKAEEEAKMKKL